MSLDRELDWVAKLSVLEQYRERDGLDWSHPKLQLVDLQYADLRPERGLYHRFVERGRMDRLLTEAEIVAAVQDPPEDTRAYFRGRCLAQYAEHVAAASWDSVIFDLPGHESLQRVPTLEPLRGTRAHVGGLLDRCRTAEDLVKAITGGSQALTTRATAPGTASRAVPDCEGFGQGYDHPLGTCLTSACACRVQ